MGYRGIPSEPVATLPGAAGTACRFNLLSLRTRAMDVIDRNSGKETSMATFTIDSENNITGYAPGEAISTGNSERFTTAGELAALAEQWPAARLVEVWNSISGLTPVKKFTSRKTAIARIWKAAQSLVSGPNTPDVRKNPAKASKRATPKPKAHTARDGSKKADIIRLLERAKGATLADLMNETGWQAHSVRGFISGTLGKALRLKVESFKTEKGERTYRLK